MSIRQFVHKHLLSAKFVLDTSMHYGFSDGKEENFMSMWTILNMQKTKIAVTNI